MQIRPINIFDLLFVVLLIFKVKQIDPVPTWFEVFLPWILEIVFRIVGHYYKIAKVPERIAFRIWQWQTARKVKKGAKQAADKVMDSFKTANPGSHIRRDKTGK